jgi:hypothetical protein
VSFGEFLKDKHRGIYMDKNQPIGILLRGLSIKRLPEIYKKFNNCVLVNWWDIEFKLFDEYIIDKNIILYSNAANLHAKYSETHTYTNPETYKRYKIDSFGFPFSTTYFEEKPIAKFLNIIKKYGVTKIHSIPNMYSDEAMRRPRNCGMNAILYFTLVMKFKEIWICGLDFYSDDIKYVNNKKKERDMKPERDRMLNRFSNYVQKCKDTKFNIVSNYDDKFFAQFPNVYKF